MRKAIYIYKNQNTPSHPLKCDDVFLVYGRSLICTGQNQYDRALSYAATLNYCAVVS